MRPARLTAIVCAVATALAAGAAPAAQARDPRLDTVRAAISDGRVEDADRILRGVSAKDAVDLNDLDFLRGTVAAAKADWNGAVAAFQSILNRDPSLTRVRLDLAKVFFQKGDDDNAEKQFKIASGGDLPEGVRSNVDSFLDAIRKRRSWSFDLNVALAPDTNMNAATAARTVDIYGLPFTLNDSARQKSGVGIATTVGGAYVHRINDAVALRVNGALNSKEYPGRRFDDRIATAFVGPQVAFGRTSVSVGPTLMRRWYGGEKESYGVGMRAEVSTRVNERIFASFATEVSRVRHDRAPGDDGPVMTANAALTYALTQDSYARAIGGVRRERTRVATDRSTTVTAGLEYFKELPAGFTLDLLPQVSVSSFDEASAAFGKAREDRTMEFTATVANRKLDVYGFYPTLSWTASRRRSNINLYDYTRNQFMIGVNRQF